MVCMAALLAAHVPPRRFGCDGLFGNGMVWVAVMPPARGGGSRFQSNLAPGHVKLMEWAATNPTLESKCEY